MKIMIIGNLLVNFVGHVSDSNIIELKVSNREIRCYSGISDSVFNELISSKIPRVLFKETIKNNYSFETN